MKIRELLNIMEEIEKKHHEKHRDDKTYGAFDGSGDDELDPPPKTSKMPSKTSVGDLNRGGDVGDVGVDKKGSKGSKDGSHHKHHHHKHHDTRAQELDKEFAIDIDEPENEKNGDKGGGNDEFKKMAGSLGDDLYVVSLYDWDSVVRDGFIMRNPNSTVDSMLLHIKHPAVSNYRHNGTMTDRDISVLIMNDRNGEYMMYSSGRNSSGFNDGDKVDDLVNSGVIDDDQKKPLMKIQSSGTRYHLSVENARWKTGEDPDESVSNAADDLLGALKLPSMPEEIKVKDEKDMSDKAKSRMNKYMTYSDSDEGKANYEKILADLIAKRNSKNNDVGREKR